MLLDMAADGYGSRVAIGSPADGVSYDGLRRAAGAIAARVAATDAATIAVTEPNGAIVPAALFGAAWSGASYAPLNYRLPEPALAELLARLAPAVVARAEWLDPSAPSPTGFPDEPERPAVLLFTSGTSAEPKAAVLGHDQLLAYIFNTVEFASAEADEAVLLAVPPFHIAGVAAVLSSTYAGRRIVPLPRFTAEAWLEVARAEHITHAFVVPTMLARLVPHMEEHPEARAPTLRHQP